MKVYVAFTVISRDVPSAGVIIPVIVRVFSPVAPAFLLINISQFLSSDTMLFTILHVVFLSISNRSEKSVANLTCAFLKAPLLDPNVKKSHIFKPANGFVSVSTSFPFCSSGAVHVYSSG